MKTIFQILIITIFLSIPILSESREAHYNRPERHNHRPSINVIINPPDHCRYHPVIRYHAPVYRSCDRNCREVIYMEDRLDRAEYRNVRLRYRHNN